ncbi:MAG: helix-turn-helix domain-containing protein [bacterium]
MPSKHPQFAKFITSQREARGLSKSELAREVGVHRSNVTFWEYGKVLPQPSALEPLARALKVSYEDLFALAGYSHPEGLPNLSPYLRAKYPGLSKKALAEADRFIAEFEDRYGIGGDDGGE